LTSSKSDCPLATGILNNIAFKYLSTGKMIELLFRENRLSPFMINYNNFENFKDKKTSYDQLYRDYDILLKLPNSVNIIEFIL